jgi:hypothetical protein
MRGRKPRGPEIVRELEGDAQARERLERILDTLAGRLGMEEARRPSNWGSRRSVCTCCASKR